MLLDSNISPLNHLKLNFTKFNNTLPIFFVFSGHFKKGHSEKGHKAEKKGDEEEKKTKFFDEDGDEAHDEKKGTNGYPAQ